MSAWTPEQIARMSRPAAMRLRDELAAQRMDDDPAARRAALSVLGQLNTRQDLKTPDERARDAAEFLRPGQSDAARQRVWDTAVELCGGDEKQARRNGYSPPGQAA